MDLLPPALFCLAAMVAVVGIPIGRALERIARACDFLATYVSVRGRHES